MPRYRTRRYLWEGDELPDDFGTRPGDTLKSGRGWDTTIQPGPLAGLLEERPRRRGLNSLLPTGWRRRR
jgi:hypothetical protein